MIASSGASINSTPRSAGPGTVECGFERIGLHDGPREAVEQEALRRAVPDGVHEQRDHELVRYEASLGHVARALNMRTPSAVSTSTKGAPGAGSSSTGPTSPPH